MNITLAQATIQNVNVRREKAGDDEGPIAIDISISGAAKPDELLGLFATKASHKKLLGSLFNEDGELTTTDCKALQLTREGIGCSATLTTISGDEVRIESADVNKITLVPEPGAICNYRLRVQFKPNDEQRAAVTALIGRTIDLDIARRQGELELGQQEKQAEDSQDPPTAKKRRAPQTQEMSLA